MVLRFILQASGAMLWSTRLPRASIIPFSGHLGPMLAHLGAELGPGWVLLGASWAKLRHFGALWEVPGRRLEGNAGLRCIDMELPCGEKAACQKHAKQMEKSGFLDEFGRQYWLESIL